MIAYDPLPTLISALLAILVVGLGLILLHFGVRTQRRIVAAGCLTGLGIALMHYVGMAAVRGNCIIAYDGKGVALAIAIAVIASILALEFAYRRRTLGLTALGGLVLGLAIASMHYSAMIFTSFAPGTGVELVDKPVLSSGSLALVVSLAAFVICGVFLLVAVPFAVAPRRPAPPRLRSHRPRPPSLLPMAARAATRLSRAPSRCRQSCRSGPRGSPTSRTRRSASSPRTRSMRSAPTATTPG